MISFKCNIHVNVILIRSWLAVVVCLAHFTFATDDYPWLAELDAGQGVKASGLRLMNLDPGLHPLERNTGRATKILVGVHGFRSKGYEWVYPLQTLDDENTLAFFRRWNTFHCSNNASADMARSLGIVLASHPHIESVKIIGHSYGGLMAIGFIEPLLSPVQETVATTSSHAYYRHMLRWHSGVRFKPSTMPLKIGRRIRKS